MTDELATCVAAFFRSIGKDVTTSEDFVMTSSLKMKWMSPSDAKSLLALLISSNIVTNKDGYIRPNGDVSGIDVPLAYRPSAELLGRIHGGKATAAPETPRPKTEVEPDMFHVLRDVATAAGMNGGIFVRDSNTIQKKLNVDISVAALIVLRDSGISIEEYAERVYRAISGS